MGAQWKGLAAGFPLGNSGSWHLMASVCPGSERRDKDLVEEAPKRLLCSSLEVVHHCPSIPLAGEVNHVESLNWQGDWAGENGGYTARNGILLTHISLDQWQGH